VGTSERRETTASNEIEVLRVTEAQALNGHLCGNFSKELREEM
jgi:hypothetical protein